MPPSFPPGAGPPGAGPPGATPPGAIWYATPAAAPPPEPTTGRRLGRFVVGLIVVLLVVAAVVAGVLVLSARSGGPTVTFRTCDIAGDGALTATGTVSGGSRSVTVKVEFRDLADNTVVDRGSTTVQVPSGGTSRWKVNGKAGSDVQQITCVATRVAD